MSQDRKTCGKPFGPAIHPRLGLGPKICTLSLGHQGDCDQPNSWATPPAAEGQRDQTVPLGCVRAREHLAGEPHECRAAAPVAPPQSELRVKAEALCRELGLIHRGTDYPREDVVDALLEFHATQSAAPRPAEQPVPPPSPKKKVLLACDSMAIIRECAKRDTVDEKAAEYSRENAEYLASKKSPELEALAKSLLAATAQPSAAAPQQYCSYCGKNTCKSDECRTFAPPGPPIP